MTDDGIREHHGVKTLGSTGNTVRVWENEDSISVRVWTGTGGSEQALNPQSARYLADRLYDLARRVDQRGPLVTRLVPGPSLGGNARAASLTPERRREIAKKASDARWGKAKGSAA